jgi:hypothetical protein
MTRAAPWVLLTALLAADCTSRMDPVAIRVLAITGGDFHDFHGNTQLLLGGVGQQLPITVDHHFLGQSNPPRAAAPIVPSPLRDPDLSARYDVILMYTQGEALALDPGERAVLLDFVRAGGGFVGLHCAADTFKQDPDYIGLVGGRFVSHPPFGTVQVRRLAGDHPVLAGITDFAQNDEFYYLEAVDLTSTCVLLLGTAPDGQTRPLAWTRSHGDGRVFYTALGHGAQMHLDTSFQRLVSNALRWVSEP